VCQQTNTLERRLFYIPSFKIYGSVAGFYDYGPPGCAIKQNLTQVSAPEACTRLSFSRNFGS
jgi:glycyl-tRNA synthetase (class II)